MPNSETTFADRIQRANILKSATENFSIPFSPTDPDLGPGPFETFLIGLEAKNDEVNHVKVDYTQGSQERILVVKDLKDRSRLTLSNVESVGAYKKYVYSVRQVVRKILNYSVPKPQLPSGDPLSSSEKKRNKGEQSYSDIEHLFTKLIETLKNIPGYTHINPDLQIANLEILQTQLDQKNKVMATMASQVTLKTKERKELYDGENGLREKMIAIKKAVKSQYGANSPEYLSVIGIRV